MEGMAGNEGIGGIVSLGIAAGIGGNVTCGTIGIGGAASVGIVGTTGIGGRVGTVGAAGASAASSKCLAASHVMRLASVRTATRVLIVQRPALEAMRVWGHHLLVLTRNHNSFICMIVDSLTRCCIFCSVSSAVQSCTSILVIIVVFSLSPSISRIRAKMLYATSKDRFRRELDGVHEIQATDPSEMDLEILRDRAH
ncbi:unnamed protein product [Musa hybrid cultivar]